MRSLNITISVQTDLHEQEVVDKLMDGLIGHSGHLDSIVVEDLESKTRNKYNPETGY